MSILSIQICVLMYINKSNKEVIRLKLRDFYIFEIQMNTYYNNLFDNNRKHKFKRKIEYRSKVKTKV